MIILEKKNAYLIMFIFSDETFSHSPGCLLAEIKGTSTTGEFIQYTVRVCTVWALEKLAPRTWNFSPEFSQLSGLTKAFSTCPLVSAVSSVQCPQMLMAIVPELTGILPSLAGSEGRRSLYLLCY